MSDETTQPAASTNSVDLEALLNATQLQAQLQQHQQQQQQQQGFNPLSMLALTSSLQQTNPITQNIARMLLTMNMGQLLATQQTSELLMSLSTQQDTLLAAIARGGNSAGGAGGLAALTAPQLVQGSGGGSGGFAMPQAVGHMSLKRTLPAGAAQLMQQQQPDRKKSCPPLVQPPAPARTPTPPLKKMLSNLTDEQKKKNEMFRKEVMKRLDIILLEELGADDEDEKKDPEELVDEEDQEEKKESEEDVVVDEPAGTALTMGEEGSAFRRILSRSSTLKESSGTTSPTTTGTGSGLSTAPNSPPIESDDVLTTAELLEKIGELGKKHRKERLGQNPKEESDLDEDGFEKYFPQVWSGNLSMKSSETSVLLHFISGNREAIESVLGADAESKRETIKINQRLRMDTSLGHVTRLLTDNDYSCCIAIASAADAALLQANISKLQTNFIDYLASKSIAGISTLAEEMDGRLKGGRVHVMPPCEIVSRYMSELAPNLHEYLTKRAAKFLLLVFSSSESAEA